MRSARLPSPYLLFSVVVATVLGLISAVRGLSDADVYWHLTAGRLFTESGQVPQVDPFSFTWAGQPWTTHEWLGEVILHVSTSVLGIGLAGFLFGVAAAGGLLLVGATVLGVTALGGTGERAKSSAPAMVAVALAVLVLAPYVTLRPQVLSWLLLGTLLATLITLRPEERNRAWLLAPLFLVWANLHGLYVIGLGVLALYVAATWLGRTPMAPARGQLPLLLLGVLAVSLAATMLTPAGPAGILYPLRYIEPGDWGLAHIAEWQSPEFRDPRNIGLLAVILTLLLTRGGGAPGWLRLTAALGVLGALLAVRNAPVAAVLAIPALAAGIATAWPAPRPVRPAAQTGRRVLETGLALIVIAAAALTIPNIRGLQGEATVAATYPVAAVDALSAIQPDANVLAEYGWGGYLIHRLHDAGGRVFVDGRNDMYPEQVLDDYLRIRNATDGWPQLTDAYGVEAMILPPDVAVVRAAPIEGWCEAHRDAVAVLLLRDCPPD